jgi:hypothetical protein
MPFPDEALLEPPEEQDCVVIHGVH